MNKNGSEILLNNFISEIFKVSNWQYEGGNPNAVPGPCIFNKTLCVKIYSDCNTTLKNIRSDNINTLIFAHLNLNFIRNKFEFLTEQVKGKMDILMISETKSDENFPQRNFSINGFSSPYRLDRNSKSEGIMLCVREDTLTFFCVM